MKSAVWGAARAAFEGALDLTHAERIEFLDGAGLGAEARALVDALFHSHDESPDRFEPPEHCEFPALAPEREPLRRIGRYRIERVIAVGGMGTVFEAVQDDPTRTVALKTMRFGPQTEATHRRFRYESDILARLRHPSIAQIYEAGTYQDPDSEEELPFFAMEFVPGATGIHQYAQREALPTDARLRLFLEACRAVHHGHQNGVIHRDLKPDNILVDEHGRPKVIDFGVARDTHGDLSLATRTGEIVGTLRFMSPEQVRGAEVDLRTDVHAMGAVLYELITDEPAFDLRDVPLPRAAALLCESQPKPPSQVHRDLPRDLDWIVARAMEKEPEQRYAALSELAADVQRYLAGEPVLVGPPTATYRIRKFVGRHRGPVALAAVLFIASIGVGVAMTLLALEARREARNWQEVNAFFQSILESVHPEIDGHDARLVEVLDRVAGEIDTRFPLQPRARAALHGTVGDAFARLGAFARAETHLRKEHRLDVQAEGDDSADALDARRRLGLVILEEPGRESEALEHISAARLGLARALTEEASLTLTASHDLGRAWHRSGDLTKAESQLRETASRAETVLGAHALVTLKSRHSLAVLLHMRLEWREAESLYRAVIDGLVRAHGSEQADLPIVRGDLSMLLIEQFRYDDAEELFGESLEAARANLGVEHPWTLRLAVNRGEALAELGRLDEAEPLLDQTLTQTMEVHGEDHADTAFARAALAYVHAMRGDNEEAAGLLTSAHNSLVEHTGPDDPRTLAVGHNLAGVLTRTGAFEEAEAGLVDILERRRRVLVPGHPSTARTAAELGGLHLKLGRLDAAEPLLEEALEAFGRVFGEAHPSSVKAFSEVAELRRRQGDLEVAEALLLELIRRSTEVLGASDSTTLTARNNLALLLYERGRPAECEAQYRAAVEAARAEFGDDAPIVLILTNNLAGVLSATGQVEEAEELLERTSELLPRVLGAASPHALTALDLRAGLAAKRGDLTGAIEIRTEVLEICRDVYGLDAYDTLLAASSLADLYARVGEADKATALLDEVILLGDESLPPEHWFLGTVRAKLARWLLDAGQAEGAVDPINRAIGVLRSVLGDDDKRTRAAIATGVQVHRTLGHDQEAARLEALIDGA